jgi:hypothetical protein
MIMFHDENWAQLLKSEGGMESGTDGNGQHNHTAEWRCCPFRPSRDASVPARYSVTSGRLPISHNPCCCYLPAARRLWFLTTPTPFHSFALIAYWLAYWGNEWMKASKNPLFHTWSITFKYPRDLASYFIRRWEKISSNAGMVTCSYSSSTIPLGVCQFHQLLRLIKVSKNLF